MWPKPNLSLFSVSFLTFTHADRYGVHARTHTRHAPLNTFNAHTVTQTHTCVLTATVSDRLPLARPTNPLPVRAEERDHLGKKEKEVRALCASICWWYALEEKWDQRALVFAYRFYSHYLFRTAQIHLTYSIKTFFLPYLDGWFDDKIRVFALALLNIIIKLP